MLQTELNRRRIMISDKGGEVIDLTQPLTFKAIEAADISLKIPVGTSQVEYVEYSLDNGATWVKVENTSSQVIVTIPTLQAGETVMMRGKALRYGALSGGNHSRFTMTGVVEASGNINSLLQEDFEQLDIAQSHCFQTLFMDCTALISAPVLPSKQLYTNAYGGMFVRCANLRKIIMLATNVGDDGLTNWVLDVAATGTFIKNPAMTTLPSGANGIPEGWTVQDYPN